MNLESPKVSVPIPASQLFNHLNDVKNFESLMPDSLSNFKVLDDKSFSFALKGMPEISLTIKDTQHPQRIILGSTGDKLPFTLTAEIGEVTESSSEVRFLFEGNFNPMMSMMVKGPLSKLIDTLARRLTELS